MRPNVSPIRLAAALALALSAAACADSPTGALGPDAGAPRLEVSGIADSTTAPAAPSTSQILVCPTGDRYSDRRTIGPWGGAVGTKGSTINIPAGAVSEPTEFEFIVPAGNYMAVEIHAIGHASFSFAVPVTITINYARCPSEAIPNATLAGAYIDPATGQVLQMMGGSVDRKGNKLSFSTDHLSGYAIAY